MLLCAVKSWFVPGVLFIRHQQNIIMLNIRYLYTTLCKWPGGTTCNFYEMLTKCISRFCHTHIKWELISSHNDILSCQLSTDWYTYMHTYIQHDPPGLCAPGGREGNYIMFASATDGSLPNNRQFSQCSRESMGQTIDVRGACFTSSECWECIILHAHTLLSSAMLGSRI